MFGFSRFSRLKLLALTTTLVSTVLVVVVVAPLKNLTAVAPPSGRSSLLNDRVGVAGALPLEDNGATGGNNTAGGAGGRSSRIRPAANGTFTPQSFLGRDWRGYVNVPLVSANGEDAGEESAVERASSALVDPPAETLLHRGKQRGRGKDVVMGLACYPGDFMFGFRILIGSLRYTGYGGHIILGVHPNISREERAYLNRMDVTYYAVELAVCDPRIFVEGEESGEKSEGVRGWCTRGLETLRMEWGRYEMARRWLRACGECTGWAMVLDTQDVFFQAHPFAALPPPDDSVSPDLLLVEEIAPYTNTLVPGELHRSSTLESNGRYTGRIRKCYGDEPLERVGGKPALCSGTVLGTRVGMHRFLSVLVDEFRSNNVKPNRMCQSPHQTDQWIMNYLYYEGRFGMPNRTATLPWGTGPVLTIGHPCVNSKLSPSHSKLDMVQFDNITGAILNVNEPPSSPMRVAAVVHQYDRCHNWIQPWLRTQELSNVKDF